MKKTMKKTMALLLSAGMIMAMTPAAVFANEENIEETTTPAVEQNLQVQTPAAPATEEPAAEPTVEPTTEPAAETVTLMSEDEGNPSDPEQGTDEITPEQKTLRILVEDQKVTYSGKKEHGTSIVLDNEELILQNVEILSGLEEGDELKSLTLHSSRSEAGNDWFMGLGVDENKQVLATIVNRNGEDVTRNYNIQLEELIWLNIEKAVATITADNKEKTAGNEDPELTATVSGFFGDDTVSFDLSREEGERAGEYTITVTGPTETENYIIRYENGTFTVKAKKTTPKKNDDPAEPVTPDEPDTPDTPDEPVTPDTPDEPTTPDTPDEPVAPITPDEPTTPDTPVVPDEPVAPAAPVNPVVPAVTPAAAPAAATPVINNAPAAAVQEELQTIEAEEIADDEIPMAEAAEEIAEEDVPLAQNAAEQEGMPFGLMAGGLMILIILAAIIGILRKRA